LIDGWILAGQIMRNTASHSEETGGVFTVSLVNSRNN